MVNEILVVTDFAFKRLGFLKKFWLVLCKDDEILSWDLLLELYFKKYFSIKNICFRR
jgi:hypothetical protein